MLEKMASCVYMLKYFYYIRIPGFYIYKVLIGRIFLYNYMDKQQHKVSIMENSLQSMNNKLSKVSTSSNTKTNEADNRKQLTKYVDSTSSGDYNKCNVIKERKTANYEQEEFVKENKNRKDELSNCHLQLTNVDKNKRNDKVSKNVNLKMVSVVYGFTGDAGTDKMSREKHNFVVVGNSKKLPYKQTDIIFFKDGKKKMTDWIKNDEFITETEEGLKYHKKYGCYTVCMNPSKRKKIWFLKDT